MKAWSPNHWPTRESPHLSLKTESSRDPSSLEGRPGQLVTLLLVQPGPARNCGPPAEEEVGPRAFKSAPSTDPTPGFTQSRSTFPCWGVGTLLSIGPPTPPHPPQPDRRRCSTTLPAAKASRSPAPGIWNRAGGVLPFSLARILPPAPACNQAKSWLPHQPPWGTELSSSRLLLAGCRWAHHPPPSQAPRRPVPGQTVTQGPTWLTPPSPGFRSPLKH